MRYIAIACFILSGCVSPFRNCVRQRYPAFNVIMCDDAMVGSKCAKLVKIADDGKPLGYLPRACTIPGWFHDKPLILTGNGPDAMICAYHEVAHALNWGTPAWVEQNYPCLGEGK